MKLLCKMYMCKKTSRKIVQDLQTENVTKFYNSFKSVSLSNKKVMQTYLTQSAKRKTENKPENTGENADFYMVGSLHK